MARRFTLRATLMILAGTFARAGAADDAPVKPASTAVAASAAVAIPAAAAAGAPGEKGGYPQPAAAGGPVAGGPVVGRPVAGGPVVWRANVLDAFAEAVDHRRPLVVVFRNDPADDPQRFGRNLIAALKADGLAEFRDRAVFVELVFQHEAEGRDEYGCTMARHLKITESPSISVVAPNVDRLTEVFRDVNPSSIDALKGRLREEFSRALDVRQTWQPQTSRELTAQFETALQKADRRMHAACFVEPIQERMLEVAEAQAKLGDAKRKFLAALDRRFGLQTERLTFVDDDEEAEAEMREVIRVEHVAATERESGIELEMRLTRAKKPGYDLQPVEETSTEKLPIVLEQNALRFDARDRRADAERLAEHAARLKRIAGEFGPIAAGVAEGEFATAEAARARAIEAYRGGKSAP